MFALTIPSLAIANATAAASSAQAPRDKIDSRLLSMFSSAGCTEATLDKLGKAGMTSVAMVTSVTDTKEDFRKFLESAEVDLAAIDLATRLQQTAVMSVYKACLTLEDVEVRQATERRANKQVPEVTEEEVNVCWKLFEAKYFKLNKVMCPSPAYLGRKQGEVESYFKAESLTRVTNYNQDDINDRVNMGWDPNNPQAPFKVQKKEYGIPMPQGSEELRARWRTLAVAFVMAKLRNPQRAVLRTADIDLFDRYTEWMFGQDVWGLVQLDALGKVTATPHIDHVKTLDIAIRTKVAELMNAGVDIKEAFKLTTEDEKLMRMSFHNPYSIEVHSKRCTACTAPGLTEAHGAAALKPLEDIERPKATPSRGNDDRGPPAVKSASAKKRAKAQAAKAKKAEAERAAAGGVRKKPKVPALTNGGDRDGTANAKGKGKGKGKLHSRTPKPENLEICFAFSNKKACATDPCKRAHVCQRCLSKDHCLLDCPQNA